MTDLTQPSPEKAPGAASEPSAEGKKHGCLWALMDETTDRLDTGLLEVSLALSGAIIALLAFAWSGPPPLIVRALAAIGLLLSWIAGVTHLGGYVNSPSTTPNPSTWALLAAWMLVYVIMVFAVVPLLS